VAFDPLLSLLLRASDCYGVFAAIADARSLANCGWRSHAGIGVLRARVLTRPLTRQQ